MHATILTVPFAELAAIWWFNLDRLLSDLVPVCAQDGSSRFHVGLVHGTALFFVSTLVDLLEQRVDSGVSLKSYRLEISHARMQQSTTNLPLLCLLPSRSPFEASPNHAASSFQRLASAVPESYAPMTPSDGSRV